MKGRYEYGNDEHSDEMERFEQIYFSQLLTKNSHLRMVEGILAPDMRAGLNSQEKVAVGEIAVQLLNNKENRFEDSLEANTEPKFELDSLVVEHVQGLLSGVIDALVTDTDTSSAGPPPGLTTANVIVPSVIMVHDGELEPNNSSSSSFSSTVVNSKSTFQNNSHLILTDNGEVTIFLLDKDRKKEEKNHRESESIQSMSSSSSSNGNFQNITFSQVSSTPEGFKASNGSNFKMSEISSSGMQFQNSTNQFVMDSGNENIFPINRNVDEEQSLGNNTTEENISFNKTESLSENFSTISPENTNTTVTTTASTPGSTSTTTTTTTTTRPGGR